MTNMQHTWQHTCGIRATCSTQHDKHATYMATYIATYVRHACTWQHASGSMRHTCGMHAAYMQHTYMRHTWQDTCGMHGNTHATCMQQAHGIHATSILGDIHATYMRHAWDMPGKYTCMRHTCDIHVTCDIHAAYMAAHTWHIWQQICNKHATCMQHMATYIATYMMTYVRHV